VVSVPVLAVGSAAKLEQYIAKSHCSSSETMEGLYLKHEDGGRVVGRYKFVRSAFLQAAEDWTDRPIEPNLLRPGVKLFE
jgi:hypothetical protein